MEARTRIFLCGNSVVVGSVGASLERVRQFEALRSATLSPDPTELDALAPDVVVFDVESGHAGPVFFLLETRPALLVLGVSPECDVVRLWSRRQYHALSSQDLAALIEDATDSSTSQECPFITSQRAKEA